MKPISHSLVWWIKTSLVFCAILAGGHMPALAQATSGKISFFQDSTIDVDRRVVKLLGGSTWLLDTESLLLPAQDVIVIFPEPDPTEGEKDIKNSAVVICHAGTHMLP